MPQPQRDPPAHVSPSDARHWSGCPFCHATPGQRCRGYGNRRLSGVHAARIARAKAATHLDHHDRRSTQHVSTPQADLEPEPQPSLHTSYPICCPACKQPYTLRDGHLHPNHRAGCRFRVVLTSCAVAGCKETLRVTVPALYVNDGKPWRCDQHRTRPHPE